MNLYLKHFGMREAPFKITPTTEFFYGGGRRGEILYALQYAIEVGEGISMVTGEVGSGKTMLLRTLSEKLPDNVELVYIANPSISGGAILYNICEELELDIDTTRPDAVRRLQQYLIDRHAKGKRVVALIDEAQAMPDESLEEIRLLSNLETSRSKLLQIMMFGQPELFDKLSRQNMRQLRERITVALNLEPFSRDDIREYISTRLHAAGYNGGELFNKDGCHLLAVVSQGLSRRINVLADKALLSAFERGSERVLYEDVRRAVRDANFGRMRYRSEQARRFSRRLTVGLSFAACAVLAIAIASRLNIFSEETVPVAVSDPAPIVAAVAVAAPPEIAPAPAPPETAAAAELVAPAATVVTVATTTAAAAQEVVTVQTTITAIAEPEVVTVQITIAAATEPEVVTVETIITTAVAAPGDELLSVIAASRRGEVVDRAQLGEEITRLAKEHVAPQNSESPPTEKPEEEWQSDLIRDAGLVDNEHWSWMPETSYLRQRLNATETWMQDAPDGYTSRMLTVEQDRHVFLEKLLRHFADFYPLRNLLIYPLRLEEGNRFVVTFGVYPSRQDALLFINNMPRYFTGGNPFPQRIKSSIAETERYWQ